jgi:hypothetical protein
MAQERRKVVMEDAEDIEKVELSYFGSPSHREVELFMEIDGKKETVTLFSPRGQREGYHGPPRPFYCLYFKVKGLFGVGMSSGSATNHLFKRLEEAKAASQKTRSVGRQPACSQFAAA